MAISPASDHEKMCPQAPPLPDPPARTYPRRKLLVDGSSLTGVSTTSRDMWDRLFDEAFRADVKISTDNGGIIYAHSSILGMASPALRGLLKQSKRQGQKKFIAIHGVPHDAVRVFIRFLYSSCYEQDEMEQFVLHLLVLSHAYVIPHLKQLCERKLEKGMLNPENVVDILQLALLCDAPRLGFICHRMIIQNFKAVCVSDGWNAMKKSHPMLERQLAESVMESQTSRQERLRKSSERKMYLQLYEAMEALVHICREGCRTIGPHDKAFKGNQAPCKYESCKGLELLVRHFAGCKLRAPGGCSHCKRMWQLLELHSRLCNDSEACRVPLCRNFRNRITKQSKKDEMKWRILVRNILRAKTIGGSPFFRSAASAT